MFHLQNLIWELESLVSETRDLLEGQPLDMENLRKFPEYLDRKARFARRYQLQLDRRRLSSYPGGGSCHRT
jgi:hypothetical protein